MCSKVVKISQILVAMGGLEMWTLYMQYDYQPTESYGGGKYNRVMHTSIF